MNSKTPVAAADVRASPSDHEKLQGTWTFLSGRREATLIIESDRFTVRFQAGELYRGTFTIDGTKRPRQMDMTVRAGPKHENRTCTGVYELSGETMLKWRPGRHDLPHRLLEFPDLTDENLLTLIFKRDQPELEWIGEAW